MHARQPAGVVSLAERRKMRGSLRAAWATMAMAMRKDRTGLTCVASSWGLACPVAWRRRR